MMFLIKSSPFQPNGLIYAAAEWSLPTGDATSPAGAAGVAVGVAAGVGAATGAVTGAEEATSPPLSPKSMSAC